MIDTGKFNWPMWPTIVDDFKDTDWAQDLHSISDEAHYHFTLQDFEKLLAKHGLAKLLKDMSDESSFELLKQAGVINNETP